MRSVNIAVLGALLSMLALPARADILVHISKAQQQLTVTVNGVETYRWRVSTGKPGYDTPSGGFRAFRLEEVYFSKKYDDAPMPNAVFFHEGYAVHGTLEQSKLGRAVSHGCVRLSREHAATLFALVKQQGPDHTRIVVSDARLASRLPDPIVTERAEAAAERAAARRGGQQIQSARVKPDLPAVTKPVVAPVVQAAPVMQATPLAAPPPQEQRTVARAVEPERDAKPDRGFQQFGVSEEHPLKELGPDIKRVPKPARTVEERPVKRSRQVDERAWKSRRTVDARRERAQAAAGQQAVARQDGAPVRRVEMSERESRLRAIYRKYGFTW